MGFFYICNPLCIKELCNVDKLWITFYIFLYKMFGNMEYFSYLYVVKREKG